MSNTVINWRFGAWHLEVLRWDEWPLAIRLGLWRDLVRWNRNLWHAPGGTGRLDPDWRWLEFYDGAGYVFVLLGLAALLIGLAL